MLLDKSFLYGILPFIMRKDQGFSVHYDHENKTIHNHPIEGVLLQGIVKRVRLNHDYFLQAVSYYNEWDVATKNDVLTMYVYKVYTTGELSVVIFSKNQNLFSNNIVFKDMKHLLSFINFDDRSIELLTMHKLIKAPNTEILCRGCAAYPECKLSKKGTATKCRNHWTHKSTSDFISKIK